MLLPYSIPAKIVSDVPNTGEHQFAGRPQLPNNNYNDDFGGEGSR